MIANKPTYEEMIDLVERMQAHRANCASVFDCPSLHATPEQKKSLQCAINSIFNETFKDYTPSMRTEL